MMETPTKLPITKPVFGDREKELIGQVLDSGWVVQGPMVEKLEGMLAEFTGASHAVAVTSCTTGLHLALHALGIGPGDEVLLPSFTYIASANAVEYTGARPVFCDIDLATFNLDISSLEQANSPRAKLLLPVSLFGLGISQREIGLLAQAHKLEIIEDAACSLGSHVDGYHTGSRFRASVFSLHPRKVITTGEGGIIITNDTDLAQAMRRLRNHGAETTDLERHYNRGGSLLPEFNVLGFNYRLTDIQAALGVAQMERLKDILVKRRSAAQIYHELLADSSLVRAPLEPKGFKHSYQSYVVLFTGGDKPGMKNLDRLNQKRNRIMRRLEDNGIMVRQGTHAVHTLGYFTNKYHLKPCDLPNSFIADRLSITLPLYPDITPADQERVVELLHRFGRD